MERIKLDYQNHLGNRICLTNSPFFLDCDFLYEHKWEAKIKYELQTYSRIDKLQRSHAVKQITMLAVAESKTELKKSINSLIETIEVDTHAGQPGTLELNGKETIKCFISAVKASDWAYNDKFCTLELELFFPEPFWLYREEFVFTDEKIQEYLLQVQKAKNYKYNYPYNYSNVFSQGIKIVQSNKIPCDFELECLSTEAQSTPPTVFLGKNEYAFSMTLPKGYSFLLNSIDKKAKILTPNKKEDNAFYLIKNTNFEFKKIKNGSHDVSFVGCNVVKVTLLHKRSQPLWI